MKAPLIGIERHRTATDGHGITTLVAFHGCPLRCRYCLNPQCLSPGFTCREMTPQELLEEVAVDNLYFLATRGGVAFSGGEPLLYSKFIRKFCDIAPSEWNISIETSLNIGTKHLEILEQRVNHWFIDVKDMNPDIYSSYTTKSNKLTIENLKTLIANVPKEKLTIRLPIIPGYNNAEKREESVNLLKDMGFENFDLFNYIGKATR